MGPSRKPVLNPDLAHEIKTGSGSDPNNPGSGSDLNFCLPYLSVNKIDILLHIEENFNSSVILEGF